MLTSLDAALALLLDKLSPVTPLRVDISAARGRICADPLIAPLHPPQALALRDGWALRADEIIGASNYAPVAPSAPPLAVEAGDALPPGYDCVIDSHGVEFLGPLTQVMTDAPPGANVRRPGEDAGSGQILLAQGHRLRATDLACAAMLHLTHIRIRQPHVLIVEPPARDGANSTRQFLLNAIASAGARVTLKQSPDRSAQSIAAVLSQSAADLVLLLGGTGSGASDHAIAALRLCGQVHLHGIALEPGRTAAIATVANTPVIAIPGLFEHAFGAWLGLVRPALDRLTLRQRQEPLRLPLAQKISSYVGLAEVALLRRKGDRFAPLAVGELPLQCLFAATHATIIGAGAEGHVAGEFIEAFAVAEAE